MKKIIEILKIIVPALVLSAVIISVTEKLAYIERGYKAFGGEFLVPLLIWALYTLTKSVSETVETAKRK